RSLCASARVWGEYPVDDGAYQRLVGGSHQNTPTDARSLDKAQTLMLVLKPAISAPGLRQSFGDEPFDLSKIRVAHRMNPSSSL
ncbi:MAG: hypothetical protein VW333_13655, partial [Pseudomonadales bacterium]